MAWRDWHRQCKSDTGFEYGRKMGMKPWVLLLLSGIHNCTAQEADLIQHSNHVHQVSCTHPSKHQKRSAVHALPCKASTRSHSWRPGVLIVLVAPFQVQKFPRPSKLGREVWLFCKGFLAEVCYRGEKYTLLSKLIKALLCLPRGNADLELGFTENKHLVKQQSSLNTAR